MINIDPKFLPTVLIVIDYLAAIVCGFHGDVKNVVYWLAAGTITLSVTWL